MDQTRARRRRRGGVLAMGFVFVLLEALLVTSVRARLFSLVIVEEGVPGASALPEPPARALCEALALLERGDAVPETPTSIALTHKGRVLEYLATYERRAFTGTGDVEWIVRVAPAGQTPGDLSIPTHLDWPQRGGD